MIQSGQGQSRGFAVSALLAFPFFAHAEEPLPVTELAPVIVEATGYTNYQVRQDVTPEVFENSGHIQETAPGLKSPFIGPFTGNLVTQTLDGIRFNTALFRGGPNQYYSWIPDAFVDRIAISDGGNVGGTIDRTLGIAPSHLGVAYDTALGVTETASYTYGKVGAALSNIDHGNVKTADGEIPHSSYNQQAAMLNADWSRAQKTTLMATHSGDIERTDKWNGGLRISGYQAPSVYTWEGQDYLLLKHSGQFGHLTLAGAFQRYEEHILNKTKKIHSVLDSYTVNGEYFFASGVSLYSTNTVEDIMYDNGTPVSATNPQQIDNDTWMTTKQGIRWYGTLGRFDVSASIGAKQVKAGEMANFLNVEGSLVVGYEGWFASYDRSTNTPSYFNLKQSLTSGKGESIPNPDLEEEFADTYRLGYKHDGFYGDMYLKHFGNAVQSRTITAVPLVYQPYNGGTMDVYGATIAYRNPSIGGSGIGIDSRMEVAYGENHLPDGSTEPTSKTSPLIAYVRLNRGGAYTEIKYQPEAAHLSSSDLNDVRIFGHNNGYKVVNVGYSGTCKRLDYTLALNNVFNDDGRVLGSSVDVPKRSLYGAASYRF